MTCLVLKKMKEKFEAWIDAESGERILDRIIAVVICGICLFFLFTMFVTVARTLSCLFSRSDVVAVWNLCKYFNLI